MVAPSWDSACLRPLYASWLNPRSLSPPMSVTRHTFGPLAAAAVVAALLVPAAARTATALVAARATAMRFVCSFALLRFRPRASPETSRGAESFRQRIRRGAAPEQWATGLL